MIVPLNSPLAVVEGRDFGTGLIRGPRASTMELRL